MNPFEQAARERRAGKLVEELDRRTVSAGLSPEQHARDVAEMCTAWGPVEWASLAVCAAIRPPSETTVSYVLARLWRRVSEASVEAS